MVSKLEKRWLNDSFPIIPTEQMLLVVQKWLQSEGEILLYPGIQYLNDFNEVNGAFFWWLK